MCELSLKDARYQYRNKNKQCKYCEFSYYIDVDVAQYISVETLMCALSEEKAKSVCEFYKVEHSDN